MIRSASELRIGNWIYYNAEPTQVKLLPEIMSGSFIGCIRIKKFLDLSANR
jgi:hypothetical protein